MLPTCGTLWATGGSGRAASAWPGVRWAPEAAPGGTKAGSERLGVVDIVALSGPAVDQAGRHSGEARPPGRRNNDGRIHASQGSPNSLRIIMLRGSRPLPR